jgi:hypothetical protein
LRAGGIRQLVVGVAAGDAIVAPRKNKAALRGKKAREGQLLID